MFPTLLVFVGTVGLFLTPGSCCRPKEYTSGDGQCCPTCHEGTFVSRDCTVQSGTKCSSCETGTFMNKPNGLRKCFTCTSCASDQGLFARQECTTTSDTVCDVLSGYFCQTLGDNAGCSWAEKHSGCAAGQRIKEPGSSRNDTVCEDCQPGHFSTDGLNCTVWTLSFFIYGSCSILDQLEEFLGHPGNAFQSSIQEGFYASL
ncbi:tumor necrosis factor receptor superfamily member 14-like isoform 2-T2 [Odontesthes bonariensis]|uniref:tumor necrosis factor receptor superfamily member 14-like isoform X2 n=1 Tax=Odontesthes bonariensis TaxID=219752 RepID=UPI003F58A1F4